MKRTVIRVALNFATFSNNQLNSFLILLLACLKNNPLFPNLPVKYADLQALVADFQAKRAAADVGGQIDTAAFGEVRDTVVAILRQTAGYIQSLGLTNESDVLSSGFDIIIPGRGPREPLAPPQFTLDHTVPGQLGIHLQAVVNAKAYYVQYAIGSGAWIDVGIFPSTRNLAIPNTIAGTTYSVRIQAIGGSTLCSPWSGVVTLMST